MVANNGKNTVYARTSFDSACNVTDPKLVDNDLPKAYAGFQCVNESNRQIRFELDLKYTIEYISSDINAILGYNPHEVIGKNFCNFIILSDLPNVFRALDSVISDEKIEQLKIRVKSKDRKNITLMVKLLPIIAKRKHTGVHGISHLFSFPNV